MTDVMVQTVVGRLKVSLVGAGSGRPTAVLWHSLFVDERSWERVVDELAEDRRLVLVTGPGHGRSSDRGRRYSMEECADAALEVLEATATRGPVDWVSNAWGGHVGIVLAARAPERVRTLLAAGTPVHPYALADRLQTRLLLLLYRRFGPTQYLTEAVADALLSERTRAADPAAGDLVRACFLTADRAGLSNAVVSISLKRKDLRPLLPAVQAPTLFITGSDHPDWSPEQVRRSAALLPDGSTHVIEGASYLIPLEAPDEFSRRTREFWAAHPASATAPR